MSKILVSGSINLETNLNINEFPVNYNPVNYSSFKINTAISGVGYNISKALSTLGSNVKLLSIISDDFVGNTILDSLIKDNLDISGIEKLSKNSPQSVVLYDNYGTRQIYIDTKDAQTIEYPIEKFKIDIADAKFFCTSTINFSKPFLPIAKKSGVTIATDIQAISHIKDKHSLDYISHSDILFFSHENLLDNPNDFINEIIKKYPAKIVVAGLGEEGALIHVREEKTTKYIPAYSTRKVVNTVGAGDSLFASFIHFYSKNESPYSALKKASLFASYKIGEIGASNGFLTENQLLELPQISGLKIN